MKLTPILLPHNTHYNICYIDYGVIQEYYWDHWTHKIIAKNE